MGIFDFVKSVGKKLTGATEANAAEGATAGVPTADALKQALDKYALGTQDVQVAIEGDVVTLTGTVADQATLEKVVMAVGNAHGIARVDADGVTVETAQPEAAATRFYTVKEGDTLWKVAEEVYGKGMGNRYNDIFEANRPMLSHPDKIYPGQALRIPE